MLLYKYKSTKDLYYRPRAWSVCPGADAHQQKCRWFARALPCLVMFMFCLVPFCSFFQAVLSCGDLWSSRGCLVAVLRLFCVWFSCGCPNGLSSLRQHLPNMIQWFNRLSCRCIMSYSHFPHGHETRESKKESSSFVCGVRCVVNVSYRMRTSPVVTRRKKVEGKEERMSCRCSFPRSHVRPNVSYRIMLYSAFPRSHETQESRRKRTTSALDPSVPDRKWP